jgi:nucleotide-binding universal stress UspA family protein
MNHRTDQVGPAPTHLVEDPHGVRYEERPLIHSGPPAPVTVPSPDPGADRGVGRIVVGIDGSDASLEALRRGIRIAHALGCSIEAITTWRAAPYGEYADVSGHYIETAENDARAILNDAATAVFGAEVPEWFAAGVYQGNADQVLIEQSKGAEMLVVGSRGHGGLAGVLLGSVSALCAERATCPVLIMH